VPVHADVAARFHYLNGLTSMGEAYADPVLIQQIRQFETWEPAEAPPAVHTCGESAPGPHGPVPVRIYTPSREVPAGSPGLVWLHGGGFIGGDLDMREADWTSREVCAAAGAVVVSVDYRLAVGGVCYPVPHDRLRASGEAFTAAAAGASVDVRQVMIHGMLHGFLNLPAEVKPVRRCLDLIAETVTRGSL
jgi:acetyl esterase